MLRPELRQMLKQRALGRRHSEETKLKIRHSSRLVRSARNMGPAKASSSIAASSATSDGSSSSISINAKAEPDTIGGSVRAANTSIGSAANVLSSTAAASSKVESPRAMVGSATKNMAGMSIAEAVLQIPFQQHRRTPVPFHYSAETVSQLHASIEQQAEREFSENVRSKKYIHTTHRSMSDETKEKLRQRIKQKWDEDPAYGEKVRNAIQERAQRIRVEKASIASSSGVDLRSSTASKARAGKSNTGGTRSKSNSPTKRARRSSAMPTSAHEKQLQQLKDSMYASTGGLASQSGYKKEDTLHPTADVTDAEMDGNEQEIVMKMFFGENESNVVLDGITKDDLQVDGFHGEGAVHDYGSAAFDTSANMITPQISQVPQNHHPQHQTQPQQPGTPQQLYLHQVEHNHNLPQQESHMQPPLPPQTAQQLHQPPQPAHTQGMNVQTGPVAQDYGHTGSSSQLHPKPTAAGVSEHRPAAVGALRGDVNLPVASNENIEIVGMATASDLRTSKKSPYRARNIINNSSTLLPESFIPDGNGAGRNSGGDDDDELPAVVQGYGLMTTNMNVSVGSEAPQDHLQSQPGPPHSHGLQHGQTGLFNDDDGNVVRHGLGATDAAYGGGQTHLAGTYAVPAAASGAFELHRGVSQQQTGPMPAMPAMPIPHDVVQHEHAHRQHGHPGAFQQHTASFALQGEHVDQTHVGVMPPYMGDGVGNTSAAAAAAANVDGTSARLVDHQHTYNGGHPTVTANNANAGSVSVPPAPRDMVDGMSFPSMAMDKTYDDTDPLGCSNDAHNANSF